MNNGQVNDILGELNNSPGIVTSLVISRSGMHVAGQPPEGVHLDSFAAMAAVLLSAAETASSEYKGVMENVSVELDRSRILIDSVGSKRLLVVVTDTRDNHDYLHEQVKEAVRELVSVL